jgi:hypothetical protein
VCRSVQERFTSFSRFSAASIRVSVSLARSLQAFFSTSGSSSLILHSNDISTDQHGMICATLGIVDLGSIAALTIGSP